MAVIGNAPFQGLVSGGEILDASIEGVDLSTSAIAARLGYTPVDPGAAAITGGTINNTTIGATTAVSGAFTTLTTSSTVTHNGGTASGVAYLNGSKVLTTGSALTFDGGVFGVSDSSSPRVSVEGSSTASGYLIFKNTTSGLNTGYVGYEFANNAMPFAVAGSEQMRLTSGVLFVGPSSGAGAISIGSSAGRAQYQYINFGGAQGGVDYAWQIGRNSSTAGVGPADGFYIYDIKASATRLAIDTSGQVGIGTITPANKLDVYQATAGTGAAKILHVNGNYVNVQPSYNYYAAYNHIFQSLNGTTEYGRFDNSGRLLVGTTDSDVGGSVDGIVLKPANGIAIAISGTGFYDYPLYADRRGTNNIGNILTMGLGGYLKASIGVLGTNNVTNDGGITFNTIYGNNTQVERMRITASGEIDFRNSSNFNVPGIKASGFGYSPTSYGALVLGSPVGGVFSTVCIGVDPISNTSGSFTGHGGEVMFRNYAKFITPNGSNNGFHSYITMADGFTKVGSAGLQIYADSAGSSPPLIFGGETGSTKKAIFLESYFMVYQGHNNEGHKFRTVDASGTAYDRIVINGNGVTTFSNNIQFANNYTGIHWATANSSDLYMDVVPGTRQVRLRNWNSGTPNIDVTAMQAGIFTPTIGIEFPASQNASSNANTLDDYEEGTFTNAYLRGNNEAGTFTPSYSTGRYTKVGRLVTFQLIIGGTLTGATGFLLVAGLPFTVNGSSQSSTINEYRYLDTTGYTQLGLEHVNETDYCYFYLSGGGSQSETPVAVSRMHPSSAIFWITGSYYTGS